jgi:hypothetical protein
MSTGENTDASQIKEKPLTKKLVWNPNEEAPSKITNWELNKILIAKLFKIIKFKQKQDLDTSEYIKLLNFLENGINLYSSSVTKIDNAFEAYINNTHLMNPNFFDDEEEIEIED